MTRKLNQLVQLVKDELILFLGIALGMFLFILFFQPFPLDKFDFNNTLLVVAGLAAIVFLLMVLLRVLLPLLIQKRNKDGNEVTLPFYMIGFIITVLCSASFAFYLRYVGMVNISFYLMLKVFLICLIPPISIKLYDMIHNLKQQNEALIIEKKIIQKQVEKYEEDYLNKSIEFVSENAGENLTLLIADVAFVKSADNYVEIVYIEADQYKRKLIRNTLKNIEQQIKPYTNFIRCHRICIVNALFIEKLTRNYNNHWLTIRGFEEQIPVSRQYLLKLKETL